MPELKNSQRQINTATYVQIRRDDSKENQKESKKVMRPFDKVNFLRSLAVKEAELPRLEVKDDSRRDKLRLPLDIATRLAADTGAGSNLRYASLLKDITPETLEEFGRFLVEARRKLKTEVKEILDDLQIAYAKALDQEYSPGLVAMEDDLPPTGRSADNQPQISESKRTDTTTRSKTETGIAPSSLLRSESVRLGMAEPIPLKKKKPSSSELGEGSSNPTKPVRNFQPNLEDALAWAVAKDDVRIKQLTERGIVFKLDGMQLSAESSEGLVEISENQWNVSKHPDQTEATIDEFMRRMSVEPVGRLHLERITMMPAGIERGEFRLGHLSYN